MSVPQSQPLQADQVENNAGKHSLVVMMDRALHIIFQADSCGRSMSCNGFDDSSVSVAKVARTIKVCIRGMDHNEFLRACFSFRREGTGHRERSGNIETDPGWPRPRSSADDQDLLHRRSHVQAESHHVRPRSVREIHRSTHETGCLRFPVGHLPNSHASVHVRILVRVLLALITLVSSNLGSSNTLTLSARTGVEPSVGRYRNGTRRRIPADWPWP